MEIKIRDFGLGSDLISLTNKAGVTISFTNLGARIVDWQKDGKHLILGFDSAKEYLEKGLFDVQNAAQLDGQHHAAQAVHRAYDTSRFHSALLFCVSGGYKI